MRGVATFSLQDLQRQPLYKRERRDGGILPCGLEYEFDSRKECIGLLFCLEKQGLGMKVKVVMNYVRKNKRLLV